MNRISSITCALLLTAVPAFADDLTPPPWRFGAGTTVQHWDFSAGLLGGAPDALPLNNPYGTPLLTPLGASTFVANAAGRSDIWDISGGGVLSFRVPNTGVQTHQKDLWLQVTFFSVATLPPPAYTVLAPVGNQPRLVAGHTPRQRLVPPTHSVEQPDLPALRKHPDLSRPRRRHHPHRPGCNRHVLPPRTRTLGRGTSRPGGTRRFPTPSVRTSNIKEMRRPGISPARAPF